MSGTEKLIQIEKDVEVIKSTLHPLIAKIDENTRVQIELSHKVGELIDDRREIRDALAAIKTEVKEAYKQIDFRVQSLETDRAIRDSHNGWKTALRNFLMGGVVASALGVVGFVISQYVKMK